MTNEDTVPDTLVLERLMSHPPEKIWRALTQPPLIEEWLMRNDFAPEVGRQFKLRSDPMPHWDGVIDCEVLAIETNKRLSYTWTTLGLRTTVTFTLEPASGGTLLRMEQSGFAAAERRNYQGANYGWQKFLGNLERVVAEHA
jgi:uncharacterized protein YndB with AHSA1/START domain